MSKVKVDKEKCVGCGFCISVCSDVFELNDEGKSEIKKNANLEKNQDCIKEAKEGCPVGAIETD